MCKDRIEEAALSLQGVSEAEWSEETKVLHVTFDHSKVKLADIHKKIAEAGHDTELEKAPDDVYEALPACCLYRDSE
ncbi:MAG: heavy-metal-associated domain-containing protein, partial [Bacteroidota bacterium]